MPLESTISTANTEGACNGASAGSPAVMVPFPAGIYDVVHADAAWNFKSNSIAKPGRNASRHYPTMSLAQIAALPVREHVAENAILFFWITGPFLVQGAHLPIMKAWGFKPSGMGFTWVKLNARAPSLFFTRADIFLGGGFTTRKNAEFCLIGKRGKSLRQSKSVREVLIEHRREHSRKPEIATESIEAYVGPDKRMLELFARTSRPNWTSWGNQSDHFDATGRLISQPVYPASSIPLSEIVYPEVAA